MPALPDIARAAGIETVPFVASVLAISAAITRVLAVPAVAALIDRLTTRPARPAENPSSVTYMGQHRLEDRKEDKP